MKKKWFFTILMVLALLVPAATAFAKGDCPPKSEADAYAYAYADVGDIEILTSGLNEINHEMTITYVIPYNTYAESGAAAQTGYNLYTEASAEASAYADGWAWGSLTKPDGSLAWWFDTGIVSVTDYDQDKEVHLIFPSDASASAYAEFNKVLVFTTTIKLDQIGDWQAYVGADSLAAAFAQAGYKVCFCKCSSGVDCAYASDYDFAELLKIFRVFDAPQLPSLKLWMHTDGYVLELYRAPNLINPWTVKSLWQMPVSYVIPYNESLAGNGAWVDIGRGVYFVQYWDPVNGHSAPLYGIVAYLSKVTGVEVHTWPAGDAVWTDGAIIFAPIPVAEMIQGTYEALGRNPSEEELGSVMTALLYLPKDSYAAYLATIE
jgi:hypothetical protein